MSGDIRVRGSITRARQHVCAATQLRSSIHERGTIANIDVNEAATNETIRVAAIHKKIVYVCNGWHGSYSNSIQSNIVKYKLFKISTKVSGYFIPVVHNLFRPRATKRSLKPFGGQTCLAT